MAMGSAAADLAVPVTQSGSYDRFAGICGILAGLSGLLYAISFVFLKQVVPINLFLMLSGLLASVVLVAIYANVREREPEFSLWALLLGTVGVLGSVIHGGYDLANGINVPANVSEDLLSLPSQVDPRGILTFGIAGIGVLIFSWLILRSGRFPAGLGYLGYLLGLLMIIIYLGRLIVLNPNNLVILIPVALAGFVVNPIWYIWLGLSLLRRPAG